MTMVKIDKKLFELIQKEVDDGYVSCRIHPFIEYYIYNYTKKTQIEWRWNESTIICRGLILDKDLNIITRPFKKFFTLEQWKDLRNNVSHLYGVKYKKMFNGDFEVTDKWDGSLGILFYNPKAKRFEMATRGSFESEQAIKATELLNTKYKVEGYDPSLTYLFEIIYPENRIVVDYKKEEKLVLIGCINNKTGRDISLPLFPCSANLFCCFPQVRYHQIQDWRSLEALNTKNKEGFVIRFLDNDIRVKIKFKDYKRIHKIISSATEKNILEWLTTGFEYGTILEQLPPNLSSKVLSTIHSFLYQFKEIQKKAFSIVEEGKNLERKDFAIKYRDNPYRGIAFSIMDGKDWENHIWKTIKIGLCKTI